MFRLLRRGNSASSTDKEDEELPFEPPANSVAFPLGMLTGPSREDTSVPSRWPATGAALPKATLGQQNKQDPCQKGKRPQERKELPGKVGLPVASGLSVEAKLSREKWPPGDHASPEAKRGPIEARSPRDKSAIEETIKEDEDWLARKRLTGAIGRLVHYVEGEKPTEDILGLCSTRHGLIMVTAVRRHGSAARAGVVPGDQLVSIDGGTQAMKGRSASAICASLQAPVTLVFLGFVGRLQAEVRVKNPLVPLCGLPAAMDIIARSCSQEMWGEVRLCDTIVFQPSTSIFIATGADSLKAEEGDKEQLSHLYELQREDARSLLKSALSHEDIYSI